jgi:hypothetical protein
VKANTTFIFGLVVSISLIPLVSLAASTTSQATTTPLSVQMPQETPQPEGLSSCFDHYHFSSIYTSLSSSLSKVSSGVPITFSGTITNTNAYEVRNVDVYAKVLQARSQIHDVNGPDVIAWVPVASGIYLKAGESKPLSYAWQVPSDLPSGEYTFVTYVVIDNRFNMSGLSFTDDVIGNSVSFTVIGQSTGSVRFDKSTVKVGAKEFRFAAAPPSVPQKTSQEVLTANISNTSAIPYHGTITWKLYSWDGLRQEELLNTNLQAVSVSPQASTTISYTAPLTKEASVYFVTGEFTTPGGATSYINVRFTKRGINIPRFNFVGADNGTIFACVHSMGTGDAANGKIEISVRSTDLIGHMLSWIGLDTIASSTYSGIIPGSIYALGTPLKTHATTFEITAKLYQNNTLLDTVEIPYGSDDFFYDRAFPWILGILGALFVGAGAYYGIRKLRTN